MIALAIPLAVFVATSIALAVAYNRKRGRYVVEDKCEYISFLLSEGTDVIHKQNISNITFASSEFLLLH